MSDVPPIEPSVREICRALNALPSVETFSSCGGHTNPHSPQAAEGEFWVCFRVLYTMAGWRSLEAISEAVQDVGDEDQAVQLQPWVDGGLNFQIAGSHAVADAIAERLSR